MSDSPLVSVVMPAHNAAGTILRALDSVAGQSYPNLQIVVVDDASSDDTAAIVKGWNRLPLRLERLEQQSGAAAARNRGMELAGGEYIAFLDADDEWLAGKTTLQMAMLVTDPDLTFVSCEAWDVAADGRVRGLVNSGRARASGPDGWKTLLRHPCVATPSVIVRRAQALALGGFNTGLTIGEDQDLWIRLALAGPVAHLPRELVRVHDHPGSLSKREYANTAATTLPMILGHLEANRGRLTPQEEREMRATRYTALGRNAYLGGQTGAGALMLLKAAALGGEPFWNLAYIFLSSPPARWAKRYLRAAASGTEAPADL